MELHIGATPKWKGQCSFGEAYVKFHRWPNESTPMQASKREEGCEVVGVGVGVEGWLL